MCQELLRFSGKGNLKASAQHLTRQDHRRPPQRCGLGPCHVSTPRVPTSGEQGTFQVMGKPRQQCWGFSRLGGWGYAARKVGEVYFQIRMRESVKRTRTCSASISLGFRWLNLLGVGVWMVLALSAMSTSGQYWRAIGRGTVGPTAVQTIYADTVRDQLLAGGTFLWIQNENDTVLGMGQAAWNGTRWDSLAHRIQIISGNSTQQTFWFLRFQGELYTCGGFGFYTDQNEFNRSFARLDESTLRWEALECVNPSLSALMTLVPKIPQSSLYATGYAIDLCGYPASCVFRYDGESFHQWPPFDQIPDDPNNSVGYVFDFRGMTYMTGAFEDPVAPGTATFLRFNGTNWEHVPGWNCLRSIKEISIRNDTLYVAGTFLEQHGAPGNVVALFDGENWSNMGGGLVHTPAPESSAGLGMAWFHDELWVGGLFTQAGGIPAESLAKWNGHQWCSLPSDLATDFFDVTSIQELAVWRDSLYMCGGFTSINGEPVRHVAQWMGGDYTLNCSPYVGVHEHAIGIQQLATTALPGGTAWLLKPATSALYAYAVFDAMGRNVWSMRSRAEQVELDLAPFSSGLYVVRAVDPHGVQFQVKLRRP